MDNNTRKMDILIAGVGGQGVVLAGDVIAEMALAAGYDVKKTDTLGMAQRGGSVVAQIRISQGVASPLIQKGEADYLLAFEKLEALRWVEYLSKEAIIIVNNSSLPPNSVNLGEAIYPSDDEIMERLLTKSSDICFIDGSSAVNNLGNLKTLNIFMLGALSMFLPFSPDKWRAVLSQRLPSKILDINLKAFDCGRKATLDSMHTTPPEEETDDGCGCSDHCC
jgi:indolepyruvate ferredoxin oxidoreductase beta subunit